MGQQQSNLFWNPLNWWNRVLHWNWWSTSIRSWCLRQR